MLYFKDYFWLCATYICERSELWEWSQDFYKYIQPRTKLRGCRGLQIVTPEVLTASWQVFVLSKPGHGWPGLARIGHGWPSAAVRQEPAHRQSCLEAVSAVARNKQQSAASSQRSFLHLLETSRQSSRLRPLNLSPSQIRTCGFPAYGSS